MNFEKEIVDEGIGERLKLNEVECCALAHAFAKNLEVIKQLKDAVDPELLKNAALSLPRSQKISLFRNDEVDLVYNQAAQVEITRLKKFTETDNSNWQKDKKNHPHSVEEHLTSLESVIEKTSGGPLTTKN